MTSGAKAFLEVPADGLVTQEPASEVRGWITTPTAIRELCLVVDGEPKVALTADQPRPDVARAFAVPESQTSGFSAVLALDAWIGRTVVVALRMTDADGTTTDTAPRRVTVLGPGRALGARFVWSRLKLALGSWYPRPGWASPRQLMVDLRHALRALRRTGSVEPPRATARLPKQRRTALRPPNADERRALDARAASLVEPSRFTILVPQFTAAPSETHSATATAQRLAALVHPAFDVVAIDAREARDAAAAMNDALARSTATFVCVLAPGDRLHPGALLDLADAIRAVPDVDVVYADDDELVDDGTSSHRFRKPEWSPTLLLCQPYVLRLCAVRRELAIGVGGFRAEPGVAMAYDLVLRAVERARRVVRVPEVLLHRARVADDARARCRVVEEAMRRRGMRGTATPGQGFVGQTLHVAPLREERVTIVVPTRDRARLVGPCVDSVLQRTDYTAFEVVVVDNGSVEPETLALFDRWRRDPRVRILRDERPFDFAALNNGAVASSDAPLILLLNNDTEVDDPNWLKAMVAWIEAPDVGAVGARLRYADGSIQHAGVVLGFGGVAGHAHKRFAFTDPGYHGLVHCTREVSAVTGACLLTRRSHWNAVGGMDAGLAVAFNDVDYCLKLRRLGLRILYTPAATLWHYESISRGRDQRGQERFEAERMRMQALHGAQISDDPYFHPALLRTSSSYVEVTPPESVPAV